MPRKLGLALGGLVAAWLGWRLFGPDRSPRFSEGQERPLRVEGRSVLVGEREFFVREYGSADAPLLVLLHGLAFDGEMNFHRVIPGLREHFRLIVPDQRAHGKSDRTRGSFDIEDLADDLAGVLDELGIDSAAVLGYSMGGMTALAFAARYPQRVDHLILGATAARPFSRARLVVRAALWALRSVLRVSTTEPVLFNYRYLRRTGALEPRHERWMWEGLKNRDPSLYFESTAAIWRFDARGRVANLPMPALQFITIKDPIVSPAAQRELAGLLPDVEVVELAVGHEGILSVPDRFVVPISELATRSQPEPRERRGSAG